MRDRFSIDTTPYCRDWTVEACLKHLEMAGYRHFGLTLRPGFLSPGDMDAEGAAHFRRFLAGHRLRIVSLAAPNLEVASADPRVRDDSIDRIERVVQLGGEIGAHGVVLGLGRADPRQAQLPGVREDRLQAALGRLGRVAERAGTSLWLENDPLGWESTAAGLMRLLDAHGDDRIGIVYDVAAGWFLGEHLPGALRTVARRLRLVQVADTGRDVYRHARIGRGTVPFAELPAVLTEIGYPDLPMIEIHDAEDTADPDSAVADAIDALSAAGFGGLPEAFTG